MDKFTLLNLASQLPEDATEIIIRGHETQEIFFSSDHDCSQGASRAQKGSYRGEKTRWRIAFGASLVSSPLKPQPQPQPIPEPRPDPIRAPDDQVIDLSNIPAAE